jgi:hypothetical protein
MNITIDTANNVGASSSSSSGATNAAANSNTTTTITNGTGNTLNLNGTLPNSTHNLDENIQLINDLKQLQFENGNGLNRPVVLQSQPQQQQVQNVNVQQMQQQQFLQQQQQSPILAHGITNLNVTNTNKENSRFRIIKTDSDRKVSSPLDANAEIILNNGMINGTNMVINETVSYAMGNSGMNGINTNLNNGSVNGVITNGGTQITNNIDLNQQQQQQQQMHHMPQPSQSNGLNIVNNYQRGRWFVSEIEFNNDQQQHQSAHQAYSNNNHQSPIIISNDSNDPVYNNNSNNSSKYTVYL